MMDFDRDFDREVKKVKRRLNITAIAITTFVIAFWVAVVYVAYHFITKFW